MAIDYTKLLRRLFPEDESDGASNLTMRSGVVNDVNSDGTVNVAISGLVLNNLPRLSSAIVSVGETVKILSYRGGLLVMGGILTGVSNTTRRVQTAIRTSTPPSFSGETVIDTITAPLISGRTYKVSYVAKPDSTIEDAVSRWRIRQDNISGTVVQLRNVDHTNSSIDTSLSMEGEYTAGSTGNKTFVVTGVLHLGTGTIVSNASATEPVYFYVDHIRG